MFSLIAAVGKNGELGKDGELVFRLPGDMKYFREVTRGHRVLMGRKTWESLPKKLPGRVNIVLSRRMDEVKRGEAGPDLIIGDLEEFAERHKDSEEEIFVIGGGMVYREMLKYAKKLYLTEVLAEAEADVFFPEFEKEKWRRKIINEGEDDGIKYAFVVYERK